MALLRNVFGGCVSDRSRETLRQTKLKFGVPLPVAFKHGDLPLPLVDLLVYIAKEGVTTENLFRRVGNPNDTRRIVKRLSEGKPVIFANYNFYTLASVVKKFLIKIPGGVLGVEGEENLLQVLSLGHKFEQYQAVHQFLESLEEGHQQLLALLFGTWFRIVCHSDRNNMTAEALSRSVAGSMFHTCAEDPAMVEKASRIMQLLIDNFGVTSMFGRENIEYFAQTTHTGIHVKEKFRLQYEFPSEEILPPISEEAFYDMTQMESHREHEHDPSESPDTRSPEMPKKHYLMPEIGEPSSQFIMEASTVSAPEVSLVPSPEVSKRPKSLEDNLNDTKTVQQSRSLSRFNSVKRRQLERLRQRSDWFLGPNYSQIIKQQRESREHEPLQQKSSGNSVTRASSEGAVIDVLSSDADSVFTEQSSRSESPASEPVRSTQMAMDTRDFIFSDTNADLGIHDDSRDSQELMDEDMDDMEVCYFMVEHKYGDTK